MNKPAVRTLFRFLLAAFMVFIGVQHFTNPDPFVRIVPAIELTGTFRQRKQELAGAGYDPGSIADPLYFREPGTGEYVRLDSALHERIQGSQLPL